MRVIIELEVDDRHLVQLLPRTIETTLRYELLDAMRRHGELASSSIIDDAGIVDINIKLEDKRQRISK